MTRREGCAAALRGGGLGGWRRRIGVLMAGLAAMGVSAASSPAAAAIPAAERAALVALYNATNGPGWTNRTGWLGAPGTECSWHGVDCSEGGTSVILITLDANELAGSIPPELGHLSNLTYLSLRENQLSGSLPAALGELGSLTHLDLTLNGLTGGIPAALADAGSLRFMSLDNNQLTGPIPRELGSLAALEGLYLSENDLSGQIPPELGGLSSLTALYLSGNQLSGPIPPELGDLENLIILSLSQNSLRGTLPAELGDLVNLEQAWFSHNHLWGDVPASLLGWTALPDGAGLDLRENHFDTEVDPQLLAFLNSKQVTGDWLSSQTEAPFCIPDETTLCIAAHGREWRARMSWQRLAAGGDALAVPLGDAGITQGGSFAFRSATNPEVLLKILNFCPLGGASYAVFFAATTDAGFALTVDDPERGQSITYTNEELVPAAPVQDLDTPFLCE
jgi:hypothetical protein